MGKFISVQSVITTLKIFVIGLPIAIIGGIVQWLIGVLSLGVILSTILYVMWFIVTLFLWGWVANTIWGWK